MRVRPQSESAKSLGVAIRLIVSFPSLDTSIIKVASEAIVAAAHAFRSRGFAKAVVRARDLLQLRLAHRSDAEGVCGLPGLNLRIALLPPRVGSE